MPLPDQNITEAQRILQSEDANPVLADSAYVDGSWDPWTPSSTPDLDSINPTEDTLRIADVEEIFGSRSFIPHDAGGNQSLPTFTLTDNIVYQLALLILLVAYCYLIFVYSSETRKFLKMSRGQSPGKKFLDESGNHIFVNFNRLLAVVFFFMLGISAVRFAEIWMPEEKISAVGNYTAVFFVPAVSILFYLVFTFQRLFLNICGSLTFSQKTIARIIALKRLAMGSAALAGAPPAILMALARGVWPHLFGYALCAALVFYIIYYVYKSFILFIEKKVSILLWILYLCIVEIMPICVLVLVIFRHAQG